MLMKRTEKKMSKYLMLGIFCMLAIYAVADDDSKDIGTVIGIDLGTTYSW